MDEIINQTEEKILVPETIDEMRKVCTEEWAVEVFKSGELLKTCNELLFDDVSLALRELYLNADNSKESGKPLKRADIFQGVKSALGISETAISKEAEDKLSAFTDDKELLSKAEFAAYNQREMADLLRNGCKEIILCDGEFRIPCSIENITYIAVGKPKIVSALKRTELTAKHIAVRNHSFADDNENDEEIAEISTDFLADKFQPQIFLEKRMKDNTKYDSKSECKECMQNHVDSCYNEAAKYLDSTRSCGINKQASNYYDKMLTDALKKHEKRLKGGLSADDYSELEKLCSCFKKLNEIYTEELTSGDYYRLYDRSYFYNCPEIEEAYGGTKTVGLLFEREVEVKKYYYTKGYEVTQTLNKDLNKLLETFWTFAYKEYLSNVQGKVLEILTKLKKAEKDEVFQEDDMTDYEAII